MRITTYELDNADLFTVELPEGAEILGLTVGSFGNGMMQVCEDETQPIETVTIYSAAWSPDGPVDLTFDPAGKRLLGTCLARIYWTD